MENISTNPRNPESELRCAYQYVMNCCMIARGEPPRPSGAGPYPGVNLDDVIIIYKQAFNAHRDGNRLAAERWAKTAQHLAGAFCHEAKIRFLEAHFSDLPYLSGASAQDYGLIERSDTTEDLLNSVSGHLPENLPDAQHRMQRYLARAYEQLEALKNPEETHELLRSERIKAANEYGRCIESMELAHAGRTIKKAA